MQTTKLNNSYSKLKEQFTLLCNEPMKNHTSMKIGGPADLFAMPETKKELIALVQASSKEGISLTISGGGTNLLVRDKGIRGLVVCTTKFKQAIKTTKVNSETSLVKVSCGTKLSTLCNYTIDNNLMGFEFAAGIPGTTGGAVMMNAGTPEGSISDIISSISIADNYGKVQTIDHDDLNFSYRKLNNISGVIIDASFLLKAAKSTQYRKKYEKILNKKRDSQPLALKSAGCIFKNPDKGEPAGKLIDMAGLKGKKIGGAMISEQHANFIINIKDAKCEDIIKLKELIEKKVAALFSVKLQTEIIITGDEK